MATVMVDLHGKILEIGEDMRWRRVTTSPLTEEDVNLIEFADQNYGPDFHQTWLGYYPAPQLPAAEALAKEYGGTVLEATITAVDTSDSSAEQ